MSATMSKPQPNIVLPVGYRLGEYVIENVLGKGGFGITYRARDTKLSSTVAIKEYFPQSIARRGSEHTIQPNTDGVEDFNWGLQEFLKEARALAKFKHQHIVRVLRFVEANDTAYMVMEYEEGESLEAYLKRSGGFLGEQVLMNVFIPVLSGLQAVHDAGLLHLDIKPDNIYLRAGGQPMLIDFGSARQVKGTGEQAGKIALTPAYSAIEQYPGIAETGPWSDVYSMGATLYRCITGKSPVDSLQRYKAKQAKMVDPYVAATEFDRPIYSKHIRESVDLAMALMPESRPRSAELLQKALMGQRIVEDETKKIKRPSGNFRPDLIPQVGSPMTIARKKKTRSFLEKSFFFLVLAPALAIFTAQLLVQFDVLTEDELYDRIDGAQRAAMASVDRLDETLYDKWRIRIKPRKKDTVVVAAEPETDMQPKTVAAPPFKPEKTVLHTLSGNRADVLSLAFLQGGDVMASLDGNGLVKLWDTVSGKTLYRLNKANQFAGAIVSAPDGVHLAWSTDNTIYLHNLDSKKNEARIDDVAGAIQLLRYSPNGQYLAAATSDRFVYVWRMPEATLAHRMEAFPADIRAISFSRNNRLIATADRTGEIRIVAASNGGEIAKFFGLREGESIDGLAYSPDGHWLATSGPESFLKLWDTGIDVNDRALTNVSGSLKQLQFSPDSKWLLAAGDNGVVQFWDVNKGVLVKELKTKHKQLTSFAVTTNGQVLATAGQDRRIRIWR
jgi:serine/threonine protein kinase